MPRTALRCIVDINIHAVSCPGVWLPRRDDVYLTVTLFNQVRRTTLSSPVFPLLFHERFSFEKVFYTCYEPSQVAETLDDMKILIELIQLSDIYAGGRLLAYYEGSARDFLYPFPSYSATYGTTDRELLLERSLDFPGISPKLEFSTKTMILETSTPILGSVSNGLPAYSYSTPSPRRSRSRTRTPTRSRSRSASRSASYRRPTASSAYRSRSVSPTGSLRRRMECLDLAVSNEADEYRPPFVVRKVDKDLIGRRPGSPSPIRSSTLSSGKKKSARSVAATGLDDYEYNYRPRYSTGQYGTYYDYYYPRYSATYSDPESEDSEMAELMSTSYRKSPRYLSTRPRSTSPLLYRSSLRDRYDDSWNATRAELLRKRIDNILRRNRSLDRLDLYSPYYYDWLYRRYPYYYYY